MKKIESYGRIENGRKIYYNEDVHLQHIQEIGFVSHFKETIEYGNKRTPDQNAYLFGGIVKPVLVAYLEVGYNYTKEEVYHILEKAVGTVEVFNFITGKLELHPVKLKTLDTNTFWENCYEIREIIHSIENLNLYIKLPHEYYQMSEEDYNSWKRGELSFKQALSTN